MANRASPAGPISQTFFQALYPEPLVTILPRGPVPSALALAIAGTVVVGIGVAVEALSALAAVVILVVVWGWALYERMSSA